MSSSQTLNLERFPATQKGDLRAWDAADELLIDTITQRGESGHAWVFEDSYGAIRLNISHQFSSVISINDSLLHQQGILRNASRNKLDIDTASLLTPFDKPTTTPNLVVIKIPKNLNYLDQIFWLIHQYAPDAQVIAGSMVKHTTKAVYERFEARLGKTSTSLAKKKARLAFCTPNAKLARPIKKHTYQTTEGVTVVGWPNSFSHKKLDIGTALFINYLDNLPQGHVVDLGCGTGVLTAYLARQHQGPLSGIDISFSSIESSRETALANQVKGSFSAQNGLFETASNSLSAVVCNPPFHDGHAVGDETAFNMFKEAFRCLRPGGELRIVGNRHLGYHATLNKLFGNCRQLGQDSKFVILSAFKPE